MSFPQEVGVMTKTTHVFVLSSGLYSIAPDTKEGNLGMTSIWVVEMSGGHLVSALIVQCWERWCMSRSNVSQSHGSTKPYWALHEGSHLLHSLAPLTSNTKVPLNYHVQVDSAQCEGGRG